MNPSRIVQPEDQQNDFEMAEPMSLTEELKKWQGTLQEWLADLGEELELWEGWLAYLKAAPRRKKIYEQARGDLRRAQDRVEELRAWRQWASEEEWRWVGRTKQWWHEKHGFWEPEQSLRSRSGPYSR